MSSKFVYCSCRWLTRNNAASSKRISTVAWCATAQRFVSYYSAFGINSTRSKTRIAALFINASQIHGTFRVYRTFGSTAWRTTHVVGQTRAHSSIVVYFAHGVHSTRWRLTRIPVLFLQYRLCCIDHKHSGEELELKKTGKQCWTIRKSHSTREESSNCTKRKATGFNARQVACVVVIGNILLGSGEHCTNGSPINPALQLQIGLWFTTRHRAFIPHVPGHGSMHRWLIQVLSRGHSAFMRHSGRQLGGTPEQLIWHEQTGWPSSTLHMLYGPHGDGEQGSIGWRAGRSNITDERRCETIPVRAKDGRQEYETGGVYNTR